MKIRQQKQAEKERKALEKQRDAAMRDAERESRRAAQPGECHRVSAVVFWIRHPVSDSTAFYTIFG